MIQMEVGATVKRFDINAITPSLVGSYYVHMYIFIHQNGFISKKNIEIRSGRVLL